MAMFIIIAAFVLIVVSKIGGFVKEQKAKAAIRGMAENQIEYTPQEFFKLRNMKHSGNRRYSSNHEFSGIYVLHNKNNNRRYVGQSVKVLNRVNTHFNGRGNQDVYRDYRNGHDWGITLINFENSGYRNLNDMEREMITAYNSYHNGYNKTRGNK